MKFIDIGANLLDDMYNGVYRGKERHASDLDLVLERAFDNDSDNSVLDKIVVTAGSLEESRKALDLIRFYSEKYPNRLFCTVGVRPKRSNEIFDGEEASVEVPLNITLRT